MKPIFIAILVILATIAAAEELTDNEIFNQYTEKFSIRIRRKVNMTEVKNNVVRKYRAFEEQKKKFEEGKETFTQTLYPFSHLNDGEFSEFYLGAPEPETEVKTLNTIDERNRRGRLVDPPENYFFWNETITGEVKSQGSCGSCYAFAAIGVIKSRMKIVYGGSLINLSEQDAMECTRGCKGGWDYSIYRDYSQRYGGCAAYDYKKIHSYTAVSYSCQASSRPRVPNSKVLQYGYIANNEKTIRTYLVNYGPLYTRFNVYSNFYEYGSGIYTRSSGSYLGGHAVILVGYGEENGTKYWILKNSWASWWGEKGYFRMIRGINLNGIEASVSAVLSI